MSHSPAPSDVVWQRLEGLIVLLAGAFMAYATGSDLAWWVIILVFFAPDLSFAGYLAGPKIGAILYNVVHVYAFGAALIAAGVLAASDTVLFVGWLMLAHTGFDRALGYGLKRPHAFTSTHMGEIGKS